tara:strand:+ start:869 stop:1507 length:639 start_codon:yes stop_codon:yes gene_type:complete
MSQIKLKHSGGNSVIIAAPDSNPASDVTLKLPQADGSANEFLKTDGSGNLSFAAVSGGISELDCYRISSTFQGSAYHITSNWERFDASGEGKKGTGVSESGGYFTFPSTGYYFIIFNATFYRGANSTFYGQFSHIRTTTDNSSYSERARGASGMYSEGGNSRTGATVSTIFKCENTSTHKVIFGVETETSTYTYGSTANNQTHVIFIKLADI